MKRIAFALAALVVTSVMAFADDAAPPPVAVTISDWGAQMFAIGSQDSSGYFLGAGTSWGSQQRIVGLNIQANYAYGGFSITPSADNGTFGLTDQNKAWVTPLPGLTVESGITLETDTWRGTADWGSDDWVRFGGWQQNSFTFFRLGEGGYMTDINYNKDGIGAWAGISGAGSYTSNGATINNQNAATDIGSALQAGAAYTIPSTATIKAQYVGYSVAGTTLQGTSRTVGTGIADTTPFGQVQVAVNVSPLVPGLGEEVGVDIPTSASDAGYVFQVSDMTDFKIEPVTLHLLALVTDYNGNNNKTSSGIGLLGGVGADYDLGSKVTLQGDLRYGNALGEVSGANNGNALTGVLVGVKKGFDHGAGRCASRGNLAETPGGGAGEREPGATLVISASTAKG